jgi:ribosomal protein S4
VEQGGIQVDGQKITDPKTMIAPADEIMIQKGKKVFLRVICK